MKQEHSDALLLFRMGDFYELFYDDAETAARMLGLSITSYRFYEQEERLGAIPMAGFPCQCLERCLDKLTAAGFSTVVCDPIEKDQE